MQFFCLDSGKCFFSGVGVNGLKRCAGMYVACKKCFFLFYEMFPRNWQETDRECLLDTEEKGSLLRFCFATGKEQGCLKIV